MTSHGNNASDNRPIVLKSMMPRAGFIWPSPDHVATRRDFDFRIQTAMRSDGGANFRFQRKEIVDLLVEAFDTVATALMINDPTMTDKDVVMTNAIGLAQAQIAWLQALSIDIVQDLIFAIHRARTAYVMANTADRLDRDESTYNDTSAQRLWQAVDTFNEVLTRMARRYNWLGEGNAQDIAAAAAAMSADDDQFSLDLPPMQIIRTAEDAAAYGAEAARLLAAMQKEKKEKGEKEKACQGALADEKTASAQAGSDKPAVATTAARYPLCLLDDDSFGAGYDDSIDPWEADGHPPQKDMEPRRME